MLVTSDLAGTICNRMLNWVDFCWSWQGFPAAPLPSDLSGDPVKPGISARDSGDVFSPPEPRLELESENEGVGS